MSSVVTISVYFKDDEYEEVCEIAEDMGMTPCVLLSKILTEHYKEKFPNMDLHKHSKVKEEDWDLC